MLSVLIEYDIYLLQYISHKTLFVMVQHQVLFKCLFSLFGPIDCTKGILDYLFSFYIN